MHVLPSSHRLRDALFAAALFSVACDVSNDPSAPVDVLDAGADPLAGKFESSRPGGLSSGARGDAANADDDAALGADESAPPGADQVADEEPLSPERAIQEADIIQLEGSRLYALSQYGGLSVIDISDPSALRLLGRHKVLASPFEMYVKEGTAFVLYNGVGEYQFDANSEEWSWYQTSYVVAIDTAKPQAMEERGRFPVTGYISDSRIIGDVLYVVAFEDGYCWGCGQGPRTNLISLDVSRPNDIALVDELSFEETENTYGWKKSLTSTDERLYIAGPAWGSSEQPEGSLIQVVDVSDPAGTMALGASVELGGQIDSRWQMDEYDGVLRVISQPFTWRTDMVPVIETFAVESSDSITPLGALEMTLPRPERLRSVRFDGDRAYAITSEQTDPLFTIDLTDPALPVQAGELELPGWVYYLHPHGDRVLGLGFDQGNQAGALTVSLFDVSDLGTPTLLDRVNFGGEWSSLAEDQDRIHKSFKVLDDENLILIPFSGWSYDDTDTSCTSSDYQSGVQLVDWDAQDDTLVLRGVAPAKGAARRGFLHDGALFTMSDDRLEAFDASDRDHPRALDAVSLARRVDRAVGSGDTLVTVGYDWWTNVAEVTTSSLSKPNSLLDPAELELPQLSRQECNGWSYLGDVRASGDAVYFTYYEYSYDPADGKSEDTTRIVTVDISDPGAPEVAGDTALGFTPNYGYGYVAGLVWSGEPLVSSGSTLVFSNHQYSYDDSGELDSERYSVHVVDLSNPGDPQSTELALPDGLGSTGLLLDGNVVATSHFEDSSTNPGNVRFYIDRIDVSDPENPEMSEPVNVPGSLLAYDAQSERAIVVDYRSLDKETTAQDCYQREAGWFEYPRGTTSYDDTTLGTCHGVRQTLRLIAIEDGEASVIDSYPLAKTERVGSTALGDDRLFVSFSGGGYYAGYYGATDVASGATDVAYGGYGFQSFAAGTTDLLVLGGIRSGRLVAGRLTLETGDSYYGGSSQLVASGQRAVVATGWQGSLSVIDASKADAPRVVRDVAVSGYVQNLSIIGDIAVAALGYDGVATIAIE